jgi:ABC-type nitrate/sulfonate/bicarbonate transport system substrate-binding protein
MLMPLRHGSRGFRKWFTTRTPKSSQQRTIWGIYTNVAGNSARRDWLKDNREIAVRFLQALLMELQRGALYKV